MSLTDQTPVERTRRFLFQDEPTRIDPLVGDASNRAYLRVQFSDGATRIVSLLPEPFDEGHLPFLNVSAFLAEVPIRTPEIIHVSGSEGALLLEDLGDTMLQDVVEDCDEATKAELYGNAIDMIVTLQKRGVALESDAFLPYRTTFDVAKFEWELNFFRKHYLEGLAGASVTDDERGELASIFGTLVAELCEHPFVICHRDYHARNLMLVDEDGQQELALIDFQDARRGPRTYDLVSLMNDSYVPHTDELVARMVERFETGIGSSVEAEYDPAALQRNLKALGTFGYQIAHLDNDVYEQYLSGTLALVRANLERNPRWDPLRRILARHCEEIS